MKLKEWEVKQSERLGSKCSVECKLGKAWRKTTTTSLCKLGSVCLQPCICWHVEEGNMPLFDTNLRIILELLTIFVWHTYPSNISNITRRMEMGEKNYKPTWQHCVNLITEQNACNYYHRCGRHRPETMSFCSTFFQPSHCLNIHSTLRHKRKDPS